MKIHARLGMAISLLVMLTMAAVVQGQSASKSDKRPDEPRYEFQMKDKSWKEVIGWIVDKTKLPFISAIPIPEGTYNFVAPAGKTFTIMEIIDTVNEGLIVDNLALSRREASIILIPTDEGLESGTYRIRVSELPMRAKTEFATVVIPLIKLDADTFAYSVKKVLGPFGDVIPISPNSLILQDRVEYLRKAVAFIGEAEEKAESKKAVMLIPLIPYTELSKRDDAEIVSIVYPLQILDADEFASAAKKMMGPFGEVTALPPNSLKMVDAVGTLKRIIATYRDTEDLNWAEIYTHKCNFIRAQDAEIELKKILTKLVQEPLGKANSRQTIIMSDAATNTVFVRGLSSKIAQAKEYVDTHDIPATPVQKDKTESKAGTSLADLVALALKNNRDVHIADAEAARVRQVVAQDVAKAFAKVETLRKVFEKAKFDYDGFQFQAIPLHILDADKMARTINEIYGADPREPGPFIDADSAHNVLFVAGSAQQISEVRKALVEFGENPVDPAPASRIITVEKGDAQVLAKFMQNELQKRGIKSEVIRPTLADGDRRNEARPKRSDDDKDTVARWEKIYSMKQRALEIESRYTFTEAELWRAESELNRLVGAEIKAEAK